MSKQELKEEHKSNEGRPEVRQRIRQLQRQLARRSARKTVPTADVVIVNPEHYAVALKYDEKRAEAPYVVPRASTRWPLHPPAGARAPGRGAGAPPLARAIYRTSQVQQQIPPRSTRPWPRCCTTCCSSRPSTRRRGARPLPTDIPVPAHLSEITP
jgi:flagellar biosynthetic protein FlhB